MKTETIQYLSDLTGGSFDIYRLAGKAHRFERQSLMSVLCGRKVTQAQAGINAIRNTLFTLYQVHGGCLNARETELADRLKTELEQS